MTPHDLIVAFVTIGVLKAIVEPAAETFINRFVLTSFGKVYRHVNPNTGSWLSDGLTGKEMSDKFAESIEKEITWLGQTEMEPEEKLKVNVIDDLKNTAKTRVRQYLVDKLDKDYSLIENARRINGD